MNVWRGSPQGIAILRGGMIHVLLVGAPFAGVATAEEGPNGPSKVELRAYFSANGLLDREMYESAAAEYRTFLREHAIHHKSGEARYGLAVCLHRTAQYEPALVELAQLAGLENFEFAAEVAVLVGQCRFELQQYAAAAQALGVIHEKYPEHELADEAAALAVEASYRAGRIDDARLTATAFLSRWPKGELAQRTRLFAGLAAMSRGDYEVAAHLFEDLARELPEGDLRERATLLLAQSHHRRGAAAEARICYEGVLDRKNAQFAPDALHGLGAMLQEQGAFVDAAGQFSRLLNEFPASALTVSGRLRRAQCLYGAGDYGAAADELEKIPRDDDQYADDAAYWLAKCRMKQGRYAEAGEVLRATDERFPKSELRAAMTYDHAIAMLQSEHREPALESLREFRQRFAEHPLSPEALYLIASTEHQLAQYDRSREQCSAFLGQYPNHDRAAEVTFLSGENSYLLRNFEDAGTQFKSFLSVFPNSPRAPQAKYRAGMCAYHLHQYELSARLLSEVVESEGQNKEFAAAWFALGEIALELGQWDAVVQRLTTYLQNNPGAGSVDLAMLKLGVAQARLGDYPAALKSFDGLLSTFGGSAHRARALFERAEVLVASGRSGEAADSFRQVVAVAGDSQFAAHALMKLGAMALEAGDYDEAAGHFERAVTHTSGGPQAVAAAFQHAEALMASGQWSAAGEAYTTFLKAHPNHDLAAQARGRLVMALVRQNRHADAETAWTEIERIGLTNATASLTGAVQYERAWSLKSQGRIEEAKQTYAQLIASDVSMDLRAQSLLEAAELEERSLRWPTVRKLLEDLEKLASEHSEKIPAATKEQGLYRLAVCLFEIGEFKTAAQKFDRFVQVFGHSDLLPSARFFAGEAFFRLGEHQRASTHLAHLVQEFPSHEACKAGQLRLGESFAALQRWADSEKIFSDYLEHHANDQLWFRAQFGLAWARENQGRCEEAIIAYRPIIERHQGETAARAQFQIGECLFSQKKFDDAVREFLKVDILYSYPQWSAAALYEAGRCLEQLQRYKQAQDRFDEVVARFADTEWARMARERLAPAVRGGQFAE